MRRPTSCHLRTIAVAASLAVGGSQALATFPPTGFGAADHNLDGVTDLLDLDIVGANFGKSPATFEEGDANGDNRVDLLDLDVLGAGFGQLELPCDLNSDGTIDILDMDILGTSNIDPEAYAEHCIRLMPFENGTADDGETDMPLPILPPPCDLNGDGTCDLLDLDILGGNFGTCGPDLLGDFNGDGCVDLLDLDILGSNFGLTGAAGAAVPEPTTLLLLGSILALSPGGFRRG